MKGQKAYEEAEQINQKIQVYPNELYHSDQRKLYLKRYEKKRQQYPTLDTFIPEIINAFKNVTQSKIDNWMLVVADTTALQMDLSKYNLTIWGTPTGNKFLQKYFGEIPLLIEDKRVIGSIYMRVRDMEY
jgi:hypothetical protein